MQFVDKQALQDDYAAMVGDQGMPFQLLPPFYRVHLAFVTVWCVIRYGSPNPMLVSMCFVFVVA